MFAFALWDRKERCLYLARDRIGEKPLYYGWLDDTFVFASELKAFRALPQWRGEVDRGALALMMRHNHVPAPYSIYKGVAKIPPGCLLKLKSQRRDLEISSYWSARDTVQNGCARPFSGTPVEAAEQLERLLKQAIAGQMLSDVPLGAFLSGGVDSSTVVALMQAQCSQPVRTFSIGFHEAGYNEAEHAQLVARHLGTDHTELYVTPQEAMDVIPQLPDLYDEPFADSSQIPTYLVAKLARQSVTVALSGDAGDELFGGYDRYFLGNRLWRGRSMVPWLARRATALGIRSISAENWSAALRLPLALMPKTLRYKNAGARLHRLAKILHFDEPAEMYRTMVSHWDAPETLVNGGQEPFTAITDPTRGILVSHVIDQLMALDLISYLPDDILVKVDRAAMGVSLETRIPLLDHRIVEFAWSLPRELKIRKGQSKWILRQVLYKHVPPHLIERPKMGFGVPIDSWLRGPLREWSENLLDERRLEQEGFFNPSVVRQKWREHLSGQREWQYLLWNVLMFQAWLEKERSQQGSSAALAA
jgi:asparagine synthase (glutamine-hydrolysing)